MGLFGKSTEGGFMDVIRCDEPEYLIWKWRPNGEAGTTRKENAIRWGSSLRVKDGEVAIFVYKQESGPLQDFIEGPFDATIKTDNFPVISNIVGLGYAGKSPFQAEIYFINLAGNISMNFGVPYFNVSDPRWPDFKVPVAARGSLIFNITDYKGFIKAHRLINFELERFRQLVRDAVNRYIKSAVTNAPAQHGIPVVQLETKLLEVNDLIIPRIRQAFESDFKVNLLRFDLDTLELDEQSDGYRELRAVTANLQTSILETQARVTNDNLSMMQTINAENVSEQLRIQRKAGELQAETNFIQAHQVNQTATVLTAAAENLGSMGAVSLGGGIGGGGFNPVGVMTGLAIGGAMGGQMAGMMNSAGANMQQTMMAPPPVPQLSYHVSLNGQGMGPFNVQQLQQMVANGQLTKGTHVWKPSMGNWLLAGDVAELSSLFAASTPPPPPPPPPGP